MTLEYFHILFGALYECFVGGLITAKFGRSRGAVMGLYLVNVWCFASILCSKPQLDVARTSHHRFRRFGTGRLALQKKLGELVIAAQLSSSHFRRLLRRIAVAYWLDFNLGYYSNESFRWSCLSIYPVLIVSIVIWTLSPC